jgi:rRNA maturation endonuclease Nob1
MRIRDTLSSLLEQPTLEVYRCTECGSHLGADHETCPDCGGEELTTTTQNELIYYWGGI